MGFMADIARRICQLCKSGQASPCDPPCDERRLQQKADFSEHLRHDIVDAKLQELQFKLDYMKVESQQDSGFYGHGAADRFNH